MAELDVRTLASCFSVGAATLIMNALGRTCQLCRLRSPASLGLQTGLVRLFAEQLRQPLGQLSANGEQRLPLLGRQHGSELRHRR